MSEEPLKTLEELSYLVGKKLSVFRKVFYDHTITTEIITSEERYIKEMDICRAEVIIKAIIKDKSGRVIRTAHGHRELSSPRSNYDIAVVDTRLFDTAYYSAINRVLDLMPVLSDAEIRIQDQKEMDEIFGEIKTIKEENEIKNEKMNLST